MSLLHIAVKMLLAGEYQEEMEHEPMRTESTGDITLEQPIGSHASDISNNAQPHQQPYINNNSAALFANPMITPHLWFQYAAALNPLSQPFWNNMGNGISHGSHGNHGNSSGSSNMSLTVDGVTYDVAQAKMLFVNMKDELARVQVSTDRLVIGRVFF